MLDVFFASSVIVVVNINADGDPVHTPHLQAKITANSYGCVCVYITHRAIAPLCHCAIAPFATNTPTVKLARLQAFADLGMLAIKHIISLFY